METTLADVTVLDRDEFLDEYWDYSPGEHVTIIGPNGLGKTTLGFQLLKKTATPDMRAYILAAKPRDETFDKWEKPLKFGKTDTWPPPPSLKKRAGWWIRPQHTLKNLKQDQENLLLGNSPVVSWIAMVLRMLELCSQTRRMSCNTN